MDITKEFPKFFVRKFLVATVVGYVLLAVVLAYMNVCKEYNSKLLLLGSIVQLLVVVGGVLISHIYMLRPLMSLVNTVRDLDLELHNAKDNLLETQERLDGIINAMPSVIIGVNEDGKVTDWNAHAAKVTRISVKEAKGKMLAKIYPEYNSYLSLAKQAIVKNSMQKHTKYLQEVAKENRYFDIVAYPVVNDKCKGAVIRIDDVTSQVLLEDIMMQTEKMNSIGSLAAGVAHEINNPLGIIVQGGQNIARRLDPKAPKNIEFAKQIGVDLEAVNTYVQMCRILEFVQGIRDAGQRAANIVNNLLQFTRNTNSQKAMCSLKTIIEKAIELASTDYNLQKKIDFRHIQIIKDYKEDLPNIYGCAIELEQVVLNILKNAAHALQMVTREPFIYIKLSGEQDVLILEIEDNGPGIKDEIKNKVFDPFFTTKPVGEGTGLGLSVSFNIIVERHGGAFAVESKEGSGTKFIIVLPIISVTTGGLKEYIKAGV